MDVSLNVLTVSAAESADGTYTALALTRDTTSGHELCCQQLCFIPSGVARRSRWITRKTARDGCYATPRVAGPDPPVVDRHGNERRLPGDVFGRQLGGARTARNTNPATQGVRGSAVTARNVPQDTWLPALGDHPRPLAPGDMPRPATGDLRRLSAGLWFSIGNALPIAWRPESAMANAPSVSSRESAIWPRNPSQRKRVPLTPL